MASPCKTILLFFLGVLLLTPLALQAKGKQNNPDEVRYEERKGVKNKENQESGNKKSDKEQSRKQDKPATEKGKAPEINSQPSALTLLEGQTATFQVKAKGRDLTYQWMVNGSIIDGAISDTFTIAETSLSDHGKKISCMVSNSAGSSVCDEALLEIEMQIPENKEIITDIAVSWEEYEAVLSWLPVEGMKYRVYRETEGDEPVLLGQSDPTSYRIDEIDFLSDHIFRVATLKLYTHPVSGKVYESVGPFSEPVLLQALPSPPDSPLKVVNYTLQEKKHLHGKQYQYTYCAGLENVGPTVHKVKAKLRRKFWEGNNRQRAPERGRLYKIVDGELEFGTVPAGTTAACNDTFTVIDFENNSFSIDELRWNITYEDGPVIGNYRIVEEKPTGDRAQYTEYTLTADLLNQDGPDLRNARAFLKQTSEKVKIIDHHLDFGDVEGGSNGPAVDTVSFRLKRDIPFDSEMLDWEIDYETGPVITNYTLIEETPIDRKGKYIRYTFNADITNNNPSVRNVRAVLQKHHSRHSNHGHHHYGRPHHHEDDEADDDDSRNPSDSHRKSQEGNKTEPFKIDDGDLHFGDLQPCETVTSSDTFSIILPAGVPFEPEQLHWDIQSQTGPYPANYRLLEKKPIGRKKFLTTYTAELINDGPEVTHIVARIVPEQKNKKFKIVDGFMAIGEAAAGSTIQSGDTFSIIEKEQHPFDPSQLLWEVRYQGGKIVPAPVIGQQPAAMVVLEGETATFSVEAAGDALQYQWLENGTPIPEATEPSYTTAATSLYDHGKQYSCVISNCRHTVTSLAAELQVEMIVPENHAEVSGLQAAWQKDKAMLQWQLIAGMKYQILRGSQPDQTTLVTLSELPSYVDVGHDFYGDWYYRVAAVKEYLHPVSGKVYQSIGPPSAPILLKGQPRPTLHFTGIDQNNDGIFQSYFIAGEPIQGSYRHLLEPVEIVANGPEQVKVSGAGSSFTLNLPGAGLWQITATEPEGYRTVSTPLNLLQDTQPPRIVMGTGLELNTMATSIDITGEAHDSQTGIRSLQIVSDQYSQPFTDQVSDDGTFSITVPLNLGLNVLTLQVQDRSGNIAEKKILVTAELPVLPELTFLGLQDGMEVSEARIDLQGMVRSSLPPEQIRLVFDNQVYFPQPGEGGYHFNISDILLEPGANELIINAETVNGLTTKKIHITYVEPVPPATPEPPVIELFSNPPDSYLGIDPFQVSGRVTGGTASPQGVTINGQPATVTSSANELFFRGQLSFDGKDRREVTVIATDADGLSATLSYILYFDDGPPTLELEGGLAESPQVNSIIESPYRLRGIVSDSNLSILDIDGRAVTLEPDGQGRYSFDKEVSLTRDREKTVTLAAWDMAGNRMEQTLVLRLDGNVDIEVIAPRSGATIQTASDTLALDITARLSGLGVEDQVMAAIDGQDLQGLTLSDTTLHGTVSLPLGAGEHSLQIRVIASDGRILGRTTSGFSLEDTRDLPLEIIRQEPESNSIDAPNNGYLAFYFNREIDPSLLEITVLETAHGPDYPQAGNGSDITGMSRVEMVEVHRDREPVSGAQSYFPVRNMTAFYPERTFGFGAQVFITVSYNGQELSNTSFTVRPLPTFIQGFVTDQFSQPVPGVTISIPGLNRTAETDNEGNYSFGAGAQTADTIPSGRHLAVINPDLANRRYGQVETWLTAEEGSLTQAGATRLVTLNSNEPFRHIGMTSQAILASGDLILDLSEAALEFPDVTGSTSGSVHVQTAEAGELPYGYRLSAAPQWACIINPGGIQVKGKIGITMTLPTMLGSHEYLKVIGNRAVLVGLDPSSLTIVPVGVGLIDPETKQLRSEHPVPLKRLDIIGYRLVDQKDQPLLEQYANQELTLQELILKLEQ